MLSDYAGLTQTELTVTADIRDSRVNTGLPNETNQSSVPLRSNSHSKENRTLINFVNYNYVYT